jgi:hypothetical protein
MGAALPKSRTPCALTAGDAVRRRQPGPAAPKRSGMRARTIITARQPKGHGAPSRPPRRRPLHARLRRLKRCARSARPLPQLQPLNGPVPHQVRATPTWPEPSARKIRPSKGVITDQWLDGRFSHDPSCPADVDKTEAPSRHPATALLIKGSKTDPRGVRTSALDRLSQGRLGRAHSSLSSNQLTRGRPTCRIQEPSVPSEQDRALPSTPT